MAEQWYKDLVVYQVWPRSFCDSNGDGIGDIGGIISKLDYIKSVGANCIWLSPIYPSPNCDYGYDIADYRNIHPDYGTLDDFKRLLSEAHARDIKIIMDLVVNHTSDQHEWFKESKKSKDNPYHDYYFWRDGKAGGKKPPNNWTSTFVGGAWEYDEGLKQYYLHVFAKEQPDLNMDNPKVREEVKDIMRFWLDMGVDGFREDVITFISKKEGLPDGFPLPVACGIEHYKSGPHIHDYLSEFRHDVLDNYDCFVVGEAPMMTPKLALEFIEEGKNKELDLMFHFQHMEADCLFTAFVKMPFKLKKLKGALSRWQTQLYGRGWNTLYLENHDQPRVISRYGSEQFRVESGKMLAAMYLCLSGTPFIYQGQEIGMTSIHMPKIEMYEDVSTKNTYNMLRKFGVKDESIMKLAMHASRDNARTPVQWDSTANAGFTSAEKPWFHINPNYTEVNVKAAEEDKDSVLNFYRKLIELRKTYPVFVYGDFKEHYENSDELYVYERNLGDDTLLVVCSFTEKPVKFTAPKGFDLKEGKLLISNYKYPAVSENAFKTKPYETRVYLFN